ncbi:MAG: hypothetical protein Q9195_003052 [Heterodermia aff. obscurata]
MPSCYTRYPTPGPSRTPSPQNLGGTCHQNQRRSGDRTEPLGRHVVGSEQSQKWEAILDRIKVIDRRLAAWEDHYHKEKVVSFSDIVVGIFYMLREYVYLAIQFVTMAAWVVLWFLMCLILGARWYGYAKKAESGTGGGEVAAQGSKAPLVKASGGGWSELYETLDVGAAKLKEKTAVGEDDERHNSSDTGHVLKKQDL